MSRNRSAAVTVGRHRGGLGEDGVDGGFDGVGVGQDAFHSAISEVAGEERGGGTVLFLKRVTDVGGQPVADGQCVLQAGEVIGKRLSAGGGEGGVAAGQRLAVDWGGLISGTLGLRHRARSGL
jgi:hypothetical protein